MTERPPKPLKKDFADMSEFLRASAEWAETWNVWPWGGPKDEDDGHYFVVTKSAPDFLGSLPSGESDPSVMMDCSGAGTSVGQGQPRAQSSQAADSSGVKTGGGE